MASRSSSKTDKEPPPANQPPANQPPVAQNFEQAAIEIEQIVRKLESGQAGLEESIALYERGSKLLSWCRGVLGEAEKKIVTLTRDAERANEMGESREESRGESAEAGDNAPRGIHGITGAKGVARTTPDDPTLLDL